MNKMRQMPKSTQKWVTDILSLMIKMGGGIAAKFPESVAASKSPCITIVTRIDGANTTWYFELTEIENETDTK